MKDGGGGKGTSGGECYGAYSSSTQTGSGTGYVNSCIHSGSNEYTDGNTVWYNYGTATAGTIVDTSSTSNANNTNIVTESICPKNWSLPTKKQADNNTDIATFSPTLGGFYANGSPSNKDTYGSWWSSTVYNGAMRYKFLYNGSSLNADDGSRRTGNYIRCVSEEKDVSDLTYMQTKTPSTTTITIIQRFQITLWFSCAVSCRLYHFLRSLGRAREKLMAFLWKLFTVTLITIMERTVISARPIMSSGVVSVPKALLNIRAVGAESGK